MEEKKEGMDPETRESSIKEKSGLKPQNGSKEIFQDHSYSGGLETRVTRLEPEGGGLQRDVLK